MEPLRIITAPLRRTSLDLGNKLAWWAFLFSAGIAIGWATSHANCAMWFAA